MRKFNKYLYVFIFSILSLSVFILKIDECASYYLNNANPIVNLFSEIFYSLEQFDVIYVTLYIFIIYFYSKVYFDYDNKYKNIVVSVIFSIIFSIITVIGNSYRINNTLNLLYSSPGQIFKTIVYLLGYYLIYYAIIKKVLNIKIEKFKVKKKLH